MDYENALKYLTDSYIKGHKHNLQTFREFLTLLHSPQNELKILHVAGTNGKGSTCNMLHNILKEAGYKTGMFTSPHLMKINERFVINGIQISESDFAGCIQLVRDASIRFFDGEDETLSYFEILTALAFLYFRQEDVDFAVIEVGIGGRLDCTNVIENPVLSVITAIGFDHMEYLGNTIEQIATEKAGIIKKNCPVVLYSQTKKVYNIVKEACERNCSKLYYDNNFILNFIQDNLEGLKFSVRGSYFDYLLIESPLVGRHQAYNILTVLLCIQALVQTGISIDIRAVNAGLSQSRWAGRMEIIYKSRTFLLDGAHNIDGARVLTESFRNYFSGTKPTIVIGILKDKDYFDIINLIADCADKLIITKPDYAKRTVEPAMLYKCISDKNKTIITESSYKRAIDLAVRLTPEQEIICCSGSLYLVGNIRKYILEG